MLSILENLSPAVRPEIITCDSVVMTLLSGNNWAPALSSLIKNSTTSIDMTAFMCSPAWPRLVSADFNVFAALESAARRGVFCRIIFATKKNQFNLVPFNYKAHCKLFDAGWLVRWHPRTQTLHAKFFIIDSKLIVIGSHNVSRAAASSNVDMSIALDSHLAVISLQNVFNKIWSRSVKQFKM